MFNSLLPKPLLEWLSADSRRWVEVRFINLEMGFDLELNGYRDDGLRLSTVMALAGESADSPLATSICEAALNSWARRAAQETGT